MNQQNKPPVVKFSLVCGVYCVSQQLYLTCCVKQYLVPTYTKQISEEFQNFPFLLLTFLFGAPNLRKNIPAAELVGLCLNVVAQETSIYIYIYIYIYTYIHIHIYIHTHTHTNTLSHKLLTPHCTKTFFSHSYYLCEEDGVPENVSFRLY